MAIPSHLSERIARYAPHMNEAQRDSAATTLRRIASAGDPPRPRQAVEGVVEYFHCGHSAQEAYPGRLATSFMMHGMGMSEEDLEAAAVAIEGA